MSPPGKPWAEVPPRWRTPALLKRPVWQNGRGRGESAQKTSPTRWDGLVSPSCPQLLMLRGYVRNHSQPSYYLAFHSLGTH